MQDLVFGIGSEHSGWLCAEVNSSTCMGLTCSSFLECGVVRWQMPLTPDLPIRQRTPLHHLPAQLRQAAACMPCHRCGFTHSHTDDYG